MENAEIKTSVDVKLGHNDMIEMLVEEQKETIEGLVAVKMGEVSAEAAKIENLKKEIEVSIIKDAKLGERKEIKPLIAAAKTLKLVVQTNSNVTWGASSNEPFDMYFEAHLDRMSEYKNAYSKYTKAKAHFAGGGHIDRYYDNGNVRKGYHNKVTQLSSSFYAGTKHPDGQGHTNASVQLTRKGEIVRIPKLSDTTTKLFKALKKAEKDFFNKSKEKYELNCQLFELEHSGKRHKAKFLKAMLGNSDTGKQLLGLMKNVGGTNLLTSGQG